MRVGVQTYQQSRCRGSMLHLQNPHPSPPLKGEGAKEPKVQR